MSGRVVVVYVLIMTWAEGYKFDGDFRPVGGDADDLSAELMRELNPGHPLYGIAWRIVARALPQDEVVVTTDDDVFLVHLSWVGHAECAGYPRSERCSSAAEFEAATEFRY